MRSEAVSEVLDPTLEESTDPAENDEGLKGVFALLAAALVIAIVWYAPKFLTAVE